MLTAQAVHVFLKKHKFNKHEAQNLKKYLRNIARLTLTNITGKIVFLILPCFKRKVTVSVLKKTTNATKLNLFLHQNKQTKLYSKSRRHFYRKIGSVYLKFEKKKKTINKAVYTVDRHF